MANQMSSNEVLKLWLEALITGHIEAARILSTATWRDNHKSTAWAILRGLSVETFQILETEKISDVMHIFKVNIGGGRKIDLIAVCESGAYQPTPTGIWGINPASWRLNG